MPSKSAGGSIELRLNTMRCVPMKHQFKYQSGILFTRGLGSRIRYGLTLFAKGERGALLMETIIALVVFVLVGGTVLRGVSTTFLSGAVTENQSIAENIARNQLESLKENSSGMWSVMKLIQPMTVSQ